MQGQVEFTFLFATCPYGAFEVASFRIENIKMMFLCINAACVYHINTVTVRAERNSPNGAIRIMAMPARCTAGRMTMTDTAALAALCGRDFVTPSSGFRVSGETGTRRRLVHTLAGIPENNVIAISRAQ